MVRSTILDPLGEEKDNHEFITHLEEKTQSEVRFEIRIPITQGEGVRENSAHDFWPIKDLPPFVKKK